MMMSLTYKIMIQAKAEEDNRVDMKNSELSATNDLSSVYRWTFLDYFTSAAKKERSPVFTSEQITIFDEQKKKAPLIYLCVASLW